MGSERGKCAKIGEDRNADGEIDVRGKTKGKKKK